ncbi:hypothetical protein HHK36_005265 [Tetracentron sinense]|uniref:HTH myb-type domain-containing protein n=1 Tax=Tetracentron sinense TaxID=13715 RepID=A0A834ZTV0_TETSI|nr:hypothetical protein HHK36_005265 [Tetracentron sinense]
MTGVRTTLFSCNSQMSYQNRAVRPWKLRHLSTNTIIVPEVVVGPRRLPALQIDAANARIAEAKALFIGLSIAESHGWNKFVLEGDGSQLMDISQIKFCAFLVTRISEMFGRAGFEKNEKLQTNDKREERNVTGVLRVAMVPQRCPYRSPENEVGGGATALGQMLPWRRKSSGAAVSGVGISPEVWQSQPEKKGATGSVAHWCRCHELDGGERDAVVELIPPRDTDLIRRKGEIAGDDDEDCRPGDTGADNNAAANGDGARWSWIGTSSPENEVGGGATALGQMLPWRRKSSGAAVSGVGISPEVWQSQPEKKGATGSVARWCRCHELDGGERDAVVELIPPEKEREGTREREGEATRRERRCGCAGIWPTTSAPTTSVPGIVGPMLSLSFPPAPIGSAPPPLSNAPAQQEHGLVAPQEHNSDATPSSNTTAKQCNRQAILGSSRLMQPPSTTADCLAPTCLSQPAPLVPLSSPSNTAASSAPIVAIESPLPKTTVGDFPSPLSSSPATAQVHAPSIIDLGCHSSPTYPFWKFGMLAVSPFRNPTDEREGQMESFTAGADDFLDFAGGNFLDGIDFDDLFTGIDDGDVLPDLEMDPEMLAEFSVSGSEESETNASALVQKFEENGRRARDSDSDSSLSKRDESVVVNPSPKRVGKGRKSSMQSKGSPGKRKVKVDWTPELHRRFVQAVEQLGVDKAVPSRILELMGLDCLTRHNIASHLQKYRSHRKHLVEAANWSHRRQIYGDGGEGRKRGMSPWLAPTMGFPPPTALQPFRPLHVPNALTPGTPCYPPPLATTGFATPPVPGIPTHAMYKYKEDHDIGVPSGQSDSSPRFDFQPSKESVDAAIGDVLSKRWLPLPLGLKPPSLESVLGELQRQGIPKIPPTCA